MSCRYRHGHSFYRPRQLLCRRWAGVRLKAHGSYCALSPSGMFRACRTGQSCLGPPRGLGSDMQNTVGIDFEGHGYHCIENVYSNIDTLVCAASAQYNIHLDNKYTGIRALEFEDRTKRPLRFCQWLQASLEPAQRSGKRAAQIFLPCVVHFLIRIIIEQKLLKHWIRPPIREAFERLVLGQLSIPLFLSVAVVHVEDVPGTRTAFDDAGGACFTQGLIDLE